jgi:hypothetical protein
MMAERRYAGHWSTRKVSLASGEEIISSSLCFRRVFGGCVLGDLHLTSSRLIWTPSWVQFGFGRVTIDKSAVKKATVDRPGWFRLSWNLVEVEHHL